MGSVLRKINRALRDYPSVEKPPLMEVSLFGKKKLQKIIRRDRPITNNIIRIKLSL
jgi:hypothetical protein